MKISQIYECLKKYDSKKGLIRTLWLEEPHIGELRVFYEKIKGKSDIDFELSQDQHLQLVIIIIGKKNRDSEQKSSRAFAKLVKHLGGKNVLHALEYLLRYNQLTAENAQLLDNNKQYALELAQFIVLASQGTNKGQEVLPYIFANIDMEKLNEILNNAQELIKLELLSTANLLLLSVAEQPSLVMEIVVLLSRYKLNDNTALVSLPRSNLDVIKNILVTLESADCALITAGNLKPIITFGLHIDKLCAILSALKRVEILNQANLDKVLNHPAAIKTVWVASIIHNFSQPGWDLDKNLDAILANSTASFTIKSATDELRKLSLKPDILQYILDTLFSHLPHHSAIITAIKLSDVHDIEKIRFVLSEPQYSVSLAKAINILKNMELDNLEISSLVFKNPQYAGDLAAALFELMKVKQLNSKTMALLGRYPECAEIFTPIFECLHRQGLSDENTIHLLFEKKLIGMPLYCTIRFMEAELLTKPNLARLCEHAAYIKSIASACTCLFYGKKLNQQSFETLLDNPLYAVKISGKLGGKAYLSPETPLHFDKGAKNYNRIREVAIVLAQGQGIYTDARNQGKHTFFQPMEAKQIASFNKHLNQSGSTIKNVFDLQKEMLIKIALMCSDHSLEEDTEETIARDFYDEGLELNKLH